MNKFLEKVVEILGWIEIVASPLLLAILIALFIYYQSPSLIRLFLSSLIVLSGLVVGIKFANRAWKGKGTIHFLSKISSSPDLDKLNNTREG